MFGQLLYLHWKTVRPGIVLLVLLCFAIPLATVQPFGAINPDAPPMDVMWSALPVVQATQPIYPFLALLVGVTLALSAWSWDHRGDHVYALSLPVPRWQLSLLKLGAGALLLLIPVATLWVSAWVSTAFLDLPSWLNVYPHALGGRFLLASLLAYALLFAMAASTVRTTVRVLIGVVVLVVAGEIALGFLDSFVPALQERSVLGTLFEWSTSWPGPLRVFTGNWLLIDV